MTKIGWKRSYHASGQVHTRQTDGKLEDVAQVARLSELRGAFHLGTVGVGNARAFVDQAHAKFEYHDKKSDAVVVVDARSIPDDTRANVAVGLVEPGNLQALAPIMGSFHVPGFASLSCEQLLIATSVQPWVYATVHWWKNAT